MTFVAGTITLTGSAATSLQFSATEATGGTGAITHSWSYRLNPSGTPVNVGLDQLTLLLTGLSPLTAFDVFLKYTDTTSANVTAQLLDVSTLALPPPPFNVRTVFSRQRLVVGEVAPVMASFVGNTFFMTESCTFTLFEFGTPVTGYNAVSAGMAADETGFIWNANYVIDVRAGASNPVPAGEYRAEFTVTDQYGNIWIAAGTIIVNAGPSATRLQNYSTSGNLS